MSSGTIICGICCEFIETGFGNTAAPLAPGLACDHCNVSAVIPARIAALMAPAPSLFQREPASVPSLVTPPGWKPKEPRRPVPPLATPFVAPNGALVYVRSHEMPLLEQLRNGPWGQ